MSNELDSPLTDRERALVARAVEVEQRKRRKVQLALAAAVMLLVAYGGAIAWWQDRQANERELAKAERIAEAERQFDGANNAWALQISLLLASDLQKECRFQEAEEMLADAAEFARKEVPSMLPRVERAQRELAEQKAKHDARIAPPPRAVKPK
jgi:hypothetical protein